MLIISETEGGCGGDPCRGGCSEEQWCDHTLSLCVPFCKGNIGLKLLRVVGSELRRGLSPSPKSKLIYGATPWSFAHGKLPSCGPVVCRGPVGPLFIICVLCDPGNHSLRRGWLRGVGHPVKLAPSQEERMW